MLEKINQFKQFIKDYESELVLMLGVILISLISFAAGRLTAPDIQKQPLTIERFNYYDSGAASSSAPQQAFVLENSAFQSKNSTSQNIAQEKKVPLDNKFVASKNSTKYHLPDCPGVKRIAEHNKIWFSSREEAESLGYAPASNCPGL